MARALEAVDGEKIDAKLDGRFGVPDRGAFVQDDDARGFELRDDGARGVAGCFDNSDAFRDDDGGVGVVVGGYEGGEEGQVDGEGGGGQGAAFTDFGPEGFGGGLG